MAIQAGAPFKVRGIDHVLLLVRGMSESVLFYEKLGCIVESRLPQYAMIELRAGTAHLDLVDVQVAKGAWAKPSVLGGRNVDHVALALDSSDEEALREHLAKHRISIVEERTEADGTLSLYVRDPSGNTIELMR